jgi:hypothetical protein
MKAINYILRKERKFLMVIAFLTVVLSFASFASQILENYNKNIAEKHQELKRKADNIKTDGISFGLYEISGTNLRPFYSLSLIFLNICAFTSLRKSKKFVFSTLFTIFSFLVFIHWFTATRMAITVSEVADSINGLNRYFYQAGITDFLVFLLVAILLFWQISILLRMLIKNTQRKNVLP